MKIIDLPKHERPREKLIERGPAGLKDKELFAILLRIGCGQKNAIELADGILKTFRIVTHNHPSGGIGEADLELTKHLLDDGKLLRSRMNIQH